MIAYCDNKVFEDGSMEYLDEYPYANSGSTELLRGFLKLNTKGRLQVVIKKWRISSHEDDDASQKFVERVSRRLNHWRRLSHPNIMPFLGLVSGVGCIPGLMLPYCKRGNVMDHISKKPQADILYLAMKVASGFKYMHHLTPPVIHGSIKGSNILINDDGEPCITDIGINQLPIPPFWIIENGAYSRWLAPETMDPDVAANDSYSLTCESDVYSFGMTLIEMYTGKPPFSHRRSYVPVILDVIAGKRPQRPSYSQAPQLSDDVWKLIQLCWAQDVAMRPTMAYVHALLDAVFEQRFEPVDEE